MEDFYEIMPNIRIILIGCDDFSSRNASMAHLYHRIHETHMTIGAAVPIHDYHDLLEVGIFNELRKAIDFHAQILIVEDPEMEPAINSLVMLINNIETEALLFSQIEPVPLTCLKILNDADVKNCLVPHLFNNELKKYWGSSDRKYFRRVQDYLRQKNIRRTKRRHL